MALSDLFAPAWIYGNQQSMDAVNAWNAAHLKTRPKQILPYTKPVISPLSANAADVLRDRIAQQLMSSDAGGLGTGGNAIGGDIGTTPSTPSVEDAAFGAPGPHSGDPPSPNTTGAPSTAAPSTAAPSTAAPSTAAPSTIGSTNTTNNQAVMDAQRDADLANADPHPGGIPGGKNEGQNLSDTLGPAYGYGVQPSPGPPPAPLAQAAPQAPQAPGVPALGPQNDLNVAPLDVGVPSYGFGPVTDLSPAAHGMTSGPVGSMGTLGGGPAGGNQAAVEVAMATNGNTSLGSPLGIGLGTQSGLGSIGAPGEAAPGFGDSGNGTSLGGGPSLGGGLGGYGLGGSSDIGPAGGALGPGTGLGLGTGDSGNAGYGGNQAAVDMAMGNPGLGGYGGVTGPSSSAPDDGGGDDGSSGGGGSDGSAGSGGQGSAGSGDVGGGGIGSF